MGGVFLVNMPWGSPGQPSIQLGILTAVLKRAGVPVQPLYLNVDFLEAAAGLFETPRGWLQDYDEIASARYGLGLGEWIFTVPPFREADPAAETAYLGFLRGKGVTEELIGKALRIRQAVPGFLERSAEAILDSRPSVVGFTSTFSQNVASLCLARMLKGRDPSVRILFGGANCDGPMGEALHSSFAWVDAVVRGEAEHVLVPLVEDLLAGGPVRAQPGLCFRDGGRAVAVPQAAGRPVAMSEVPAPDYDGFFERLRRSPMAEEILPSVVLPFEGSRGCWWGAVSHCTFCGLNGSSMKFASKPPDQVFDQLMGLSERHRQLKVMFVDNILDMGYMDTLLPRMGETGFDFEIFFETKANLRKGQLSRLRKAGITTIQPGIESFSTPILKLMGKGISGLQNIRLLKWCAEYGIDARWNLLYGFPQEPVGEYGRMEALLPSLTHLAPPDSVGRLVLERFSPYHRSPERYGIRILGPTRPYGLIYPIGQDALRDLAYAFSYEHEDGRDPGAYIRGIETLVGSWKKAALTGQSRLTALKGPGFLRIRDRRSGLRHGDHILGKRESGIYLALDAGATPEGVAKRMGVSDAAGIRGFLDQLVSMRLAYEEDGVYLSLAVPETADPSN